MYCDKASYLTVTCNAVLYMYNLVEIDETKIYLQWVCYVQTRLISILWI